MLLQNRFGNGEPQSGTFLSLLQLDETFKNMWQLLLRNTGSRVFYVEITLHNFQ